jgi:diguanylate cyclase (GGDEF)-like protein/PAS domain S-box-containing protein
LSPAALELHTGLVDRDVEDLEFAVDRIHPDDFGVLAHSFATALEQPEHPVPVHYRIKFVDGTWRSIEGTLTNLLADPDIEGVVLDVKDVTEREKAESALRASEARHRRVLDSLAEGIILSGEGGRIIACNPAAEQMLGLPADDMLSRTTQELAWKLVRRDGTEIPNAERPADRTRATGEPVRDAVMGAADADGHVSRWLSANAVVVETNPDGTPDVVAVSLTDITDVVESSVEIEQNERRFRTLIARSSDIVAVIDPELRITYVSGAVGEILGYRETELLGVSAVELIHPDDLEDTFAAVARSIEGATEPDPLELRLRHADGSWLYLEALGVNLLDDPLVDGIAVNLRDISERRRIEANLHAAQVRFEEAFQHAPIGIAMLREDGHFFRVNPAFCRMLGYPADELLDYSFTDLTHPDDLDHNVALHERTYHGDLPSYVIEKRYRRKSGDWIWCRVHVTIVQDSEGAPHYSLGQIVDVTERRQFEERLAYEATHDALTDLPLRNLLIDHLDLALAGARRRASEVAILFIDLDHFKRVNDSFGHVAGDDVLVTAAGRLREAVREGDTAGRFGGDEFVIVCPDVADAAEAVAIAERVRASLDEPFSVRGTQMYVGASIGVVVAGGEGEADTMLKHADIAAYRAKERGRNRVELFDEHLRSAVAVRIETELAFRRALDEDELCLHYQPVVTTRGGEVVGFEALARWDRPGHGIVGPGEFLAVAEDTGLIVPMGMRFLRTACEQIVRFAAAAPDGSCPWVSVNLSASQLGQLDLVDEVASALAETGAPADRLCIEITESLLMQDTPTTIDTLQRLRALGVSLAIDDFGTGYSSLSYLRRLPVTVLKIDQSFVLELGLDPQGATIVASVIELAHALGMECVAEGVERAAHLETLARLGCDAMQGFLFSRAVPAEDATAMLGRRFLVTQLNHSGARSSR